MTAPVTPPRAAHDYGMYSGSAGGMIEAITQMQLMQMFSQQSVAKEDLIKLNYYKPLIIFLNEKNLAESTRQVIMQEALAKGNSNASLVDFLHNVYEVVRVNPEISQETRVKIQSEMASGMLMQAQDATNASFGAFLKNAATIGLAMGIVDTMKRVIGESCTRAVNVVPTVFSFMGRLVGKAYNTLCNRPDPLQCEEILIWEQTLDSLLSTLCEQHVSNSLMLKNIRVSDEGEAAQQDAVDNNWIYYVEMVNDVCGHMNAYLDERLPYYAGSSDQRKLLVGVSNSLSVENRRSISFIIGVIKNNIKQVIHICKNAQTSDDLDRVHVKKLGRITLLLLSKLRVMIGGAGQVQTSGMTAGVPYQGMGSGLTDN